MPKLAQILEKSSVTREVHMWIGLFFLVSHCIKQAFTTLYNKQIKSTFAMRRLGIVQSWCECYTLRSVVAKEEKKGQRRKVAFDGIETFFGETVLKQGEEEKRKQRRKVAFGTYGGSKKLLRASTSYNMAPQLYYVKSKICYDQGYNDLGVVVATNWRHYLFYRYLQSYFSALRILLPIVHEVFFLPDNRPVVSEV